MKRTKHFQTRLRQHALYHVGIWMCVIWVQWIPIDSALAEAAAGVLVEDKVTLPSRNEATNPLKEPTPSTLQGAFLSGNLTDANNGSTNTPPADAPQRDGQASVTSTTAATAIAETVWNVRTAMPATLPVDRRNGSVTATKPDLATTNRPLESWENVIHTSTEQPPMQQQPSESLVKPSTGGPTEDGTVSGGIYGTDVNLNNKNLMANMLKSWFNHKDDSTASAKVYYKLADEYLQNNVGEGGRGGQGEDDGTSNVVSSSSKAVTVAVTVGGNNKSLFERWDEASEEQERVLEDAMRSERPVVDGGSPPPPSSSSVLAADKNTPSRWFVLLLSGNSTVAQMRRTDFAKYLKLNLAARLSLEYDEVKINRVLVVPPRLMVNVSVVPVTKRASAAVAASAATAAASSSSSSSFMSFSRSSSASDAVVSDRVIIDDDPLHNLVETNATLMELSGEEYRVERFMSLKSQKPQSMEETAAVVSDRHADIDFFIYATIGPLCFVVLLGFLLLTLYKYVRKHPVQWPWKRKLRQPSFWPGGGDHRHRRMTDECGDGGGAGGGDYGASSADETPGAFGRVGGGNGLVNVIYSGEFEQSQQQQLSGSWLDDASFVPDDSLDRIRTPTLLRTAAPDKSKTFTDMLQQCGDGSRPNERHRHYDQSPRDGQYAAAVAATAVHAQSPRLSRDNKLRILGCNQSCLLLPAVQPDVIVDDGSMHVTAPTPSSQSTTVTRENDGGQRA